MENHNIQEKHIRKFTSLCKQLNKLLEEIRKEEPEANFYLEEDSMNLMTGASHTGINGDACRERSAARVHMPYSGGGAW